MALREDIQTVRAALDVAEASDSVYLALLRLADAAIKSELRCDYCDEGLPFDAEGWHLRVDPDDWEPTQRIPCARLHG